MAADPRKRGWGVPDSAASPQGVGGTHLPAPTRRHGHRGLWVSSPPPPAAPAPAPHPSWCRTLALHADGEVQPGPPRPKGAQTLSWSARRPCLSHAGSSASRRQVRGLALHALPLGRDAEPHRQPLPGLPRPCGLWGACALLGARLRSRRLLYTSLCPKQRGGPGPSPGEAVAARPTGSARAPAGSSAGQSSSRCARVAGSSPAGACTGTSCWMPE